MRSPGDIGSEAGSSRSASSARWSVATVPGRAQAAPQPRAPRGRAGSAPSCGAARARGRPARRRARRRGRPRRPPGGAAPAASGASARAQPRAGGSGERGAEQRDARVERVVSDCTAVAVRGARARRSSASRAWSIAAAAIPRSARAARSARPARRARAAPPRAGRRPPARGRRPARRRRRHDLPASAPAAASPSRSGAAARRRRPRPPAPHAAARGHRPRTHAARGRPGTVRPPPVPAPSTGAATTATRHGRVKSIPSPASAAARPASGAPRDRAHHAQAQPAAAGAALAAAGVAGDRDEREQLGRRAHDRAAPRAATPSPTPPSRTRERPDGHRAAQHRGGEAPVVVAGRPVGAGRGGGERAAARVEVGDLGAAQQRGHALHQRALGVGLVQGVEQYRCIEASRRRAPRSALTVAPATNETISRNGVSSGTVNSGSPHRSASSTSAGGTASCAMPEPQAERRHAAVGELADEPALGGLVLAELHAGGEHHPVGLQPAHGVGQVDRMAAEHERRAGRLAARAQLEPERPVVEQIAERQPHAIGPPDEPRSGAVVALTIERAAAACHRGVHDPRRRRRCPDARHRALAPLLEHGDRAAAELTITRGDDVWLWDDTGQRYLDASASLWYVNVGHGRRRDRRRRPAQLT